MKRRFPSTLQQRATEIGADELLARVEWVLRNNPRRLKRVRSDNRAYCASLLTILNDAAEPKIERRAA